MEYVFVFNGAGTNLPCGVFIQYTVAEEWIRKHSLSGLLTAYPLNKGVYDWAIENKYLEVKREHQTQPKFIQNFSSAYLEHYHFEDGKLDG